MSLNNIPNLNFSTGKSTELIKKNLINIKGKTTEKLGVIGKEKAVACEAIISVIKYDQ